MSLNLHAAMKKANKLLRKKSTTATLLEKSFLTTATISAAVPLEHLIIGIAPNKRQINFH